MKKPLLSVVILNWNTRDLLHQCLASLPKRDDFQVIVVDNASDDDSVAMIKKDFPWVTLIQSPANVGFTRGNNLARKIASGKYVLFLNSDTKVFPQTIETMVEFMASDSKIGIATCLTLLPNGKLYYACHRGFPTPGSSLLYFLGLPSNYSGSFWPINKIHEIDACSGTFLLIQKTLLDKIGWFDEDYFAYGEDLEMCYEVKRLGYKVMFNPQVSILHYWGASSGLKSTSKAVTKADSATSQHWNEARYQAMKIFYDKHYRQRYSEFFRTVVFLGIDLANYFRRGKD
ncbi:glycosyltransferase family 2 protein [Candidatus Microgenomates bacterium]|nr:glycosyltransferase family 2 protein [Candidatus Microgenomates bacterium]